MRAPVTMIITSISILKAFDVTMASLILTSIYSRVHCEKVLWLDFPCGTCVCGSTTVVHVW